MKLKCNKLVIILKKSFDIYAWQSYNKGKDFERKWQLKNHYILLYHRKDKHMEKRELTLNIRETNEQARRRVYKSKQLQKKISLYKKLGLGAATVSLAAGIIGGPII